MRILFAGRSVFHLTYYESLLESLVAAGSDLTLRFDRSWSEGTSDVALRRFLAAFPEVSCRWSETRRGNLRQPVFALRELRSYCSYLRRPEQSDFYTRRWRGYLSESVQQLDATTAGRSLLRSRLMGSFLRGLETLTPAARPVLDDLRTATPDVVVASPTNMRFSEEIEYVKAAQRLRIPTAVLVLSWDNMSTKGLVHVRPDLLLAWNHAHAADAVRYHRIPAERIRVTGSPFFDKWFDPRLQPVERRDFLSRIGLPPDKPYVLYLGSSKKIARDESWLVTGLLDALDSTAALRGASVMVRPHPFNSDPFERWTESDEDRIVVWPDAGALPEDGDLRQDFRDSVHHAAAVVGLNTSAMIDALVLDKPCVTVIVERYRETQLRAQHFRQLLDSGALEITGNLEECAEVLASLAQGANSVVASQAPSDDRSELRRRFVRDYVRPRGIGVSAGRRCADAIIALAEGVPSAQIGDDESPIPPAPRRGWRRHRDAGPHRPAPSHSAGNASSSKQSNAGRAAEGTSPSRAGGRESTRAGLGLALDDGAHHLPESMETILSQTLSDFILVVLDNGTTNGSAQAARELASEDPRVVYHRDDVHRDPVTVRRRLFQLSREHGNDPEYFAWVRAGDLWHEKWLATMVGALAADRELALSYPLVQFVDIAGTLTPHPSPLFSHDDSEEPDIRFLRASRHLGDAGLITSGVFRSRFLRKAGVSRRVRDPEALLMLETSLHGRITQVCSSHWYRHRLTGPGVRVRAPETGQRDPGSRFRPDFALVLLYHYVRKRGKAAELREYGIGTTHFLRLVASACSPGGSA